MWAGKVASQKLGAKGCLSPVRPRPNPILGILTRSQILKLLVILKQEDKMTYSKTKEATKKRAQRAKKAATLCEDEIRAAKEKASQRRAELRHREKLER